jgi:hypothetical protein
MDFLVVDETRDDAGYWHEDCLEIFLDVRHTEKVAYHYFVVNALGATLHARNGFDRSWDPKGMLTKVKHFKDHWGLEIKIPLAELFGSPDEIASLWGVNFIRSRQPKFDKRFEETSWAPTRSKSSHVPERFGHALLQVGRKMPKEIAEFVKTRDALVK